MNAKQFTTVTEILFTPKALTGERRESKVNHCNAHVVRYDNGLVFWSYNSPVYFEIDGVRYFGPDYDYSATTRKQLTRFLGMNAAQRREAIKAGTIRVLAQ